MPVGLAPRTLRLVVLPHVQVDSKVRKQLQFIMFYFQALEASRGSTWGHPGVNLGSAWGQPAAPYLVLGLGLVAQPAGAVHSDAARLPLPPHRRRRPLQHKVPPVTSVGRSVSNDG